MIRPGKYNCIVLPTINGFFGESGKNKTPFIRLTLAVVGGPHAGEEIEYQGWISNAAIDGTCKRLAEVFGWDGDLEKLSRLMDGGPFEGLPCSVEMAEETYGEGEHAKTVVKLKWLNKPGSSAMEPGAALALAQKFAARAKLAAGGAAKPAPSDPAAYADEQPDNIPY